jgi:hypothetical protein
LEFFANSLGIEIWTTEQTRLDFYFPIIDIPWEQSEGVKQKLTTVKETSTLNEMT